MKHLLYLLWIPVFISACSGRMSPLSKRVYNDTVYQQFWTADWSGDGKFIAIGGVDSILRIYSGPGMRLLRSYPLKSWIHSAKWHPDNTTLAVATLEGVNILNVVDGSMKKLILKIGARAIGWNHDGRLLAIGDLNGMVHVADKSGELLNSVDTQYDPDQPGTSFTSLDWHPVENIFIATNFEIGKFDSSGRKISSMEHRNKNALMLAVDWHPSGKYFVIGDYGHNWSGENVPSLLHYWSEDGNYLKAIAGNIGEIRNIAFSRDGTLLASASDVLRIWKSSGELLHESKFDGSDFLWGISWNPDGSRLVTSSRHKTIAWWNKQARLLKKIEVGGY